MNKSKKVGEWINACMTVFLIGMLGIFPLYYDDKYFNMGEAKYLFVKQFSIYLFAVVGVLGVLYFLFSKKEKKKIKISITDGFVFSYAVIVLLSYAISSYKETAFWGYAGWNMGLFAQLLFIAIYYFVSRFYRWENFMLFPILIASTIVFGLAVLHRFQIDPLGMYEGVSETQHILFLTTIGQATWYSSYLCIIFPLGIFLYWYTKHTWLRILMGIYSAIGFMSIVTQNSDSAFLALAFVLLVLCSFSLKENRKWKRFMEILLIGAGSFIFIGILQIIFVDRSMKLEPLSIFVSQSVVTKIFFGAILIAYLLFIRMEKKKNFYIQKYSFLGKTMWILVAIGTVLTIFLIYLTTKGLLPKGLSFLKEIAYFNFDTNWGNGRGFSWQTSMMIFEEFPFINKLFGCGPDCFAPYSYDYYSELLTSKWGDAVLTNAHNEWLTSLLFFGITGFVAYIGIFLSQIIRYSKKALENPLVIVPLMCIVAYMVHNFFCYQQIVCTPIIFIIMGIGEAFIRREKNAL